MITYSMDLGIDTHATGGAAGLPLSPYPLQISLSTGAIADGVYTPTGLASWRAIVSGDELIVRVFDITLSGTLLVSVIWGACTAYGPDLGPKHLFTGETFVKAPTEQLCPGFATASSALLSCWILRDGDTVGAAIKTYPIETVTAPTQYLFSVTLGARLEEGPDVLVARFYQVDPEMVVSPDDSGGVLPAK